MTTPSIPLPISATALATIGTQTLSAIPGSTGLVLPNGSTAMPGLVTTLSDSNSQPIVVSVGTSGVYIGGTNAGDSTSYYANPTIPPVAIATVANQVVSAAPGATNVVVGSQTAYLGGGAITVSGSLIQLTPSGVVVNGGSSGGPVNTYAIPTLAGTHEIVAPTAIATIGGQIISAAPGDSTVIINGQVVTAGGAPVTLAGSNNIASLGASGLVVQYPGGSVSSYALPTVAPTPIATVGGQVISAAPGDSTVVINGQIITAGGAPITLAGSNNVASLGASGLVVHYPGGSISTYALPTAAPSAGAIVGTVEGIPISVSAGASVISIGSQIVTLGGPPVTIAGNDVVSLGPSGLEIQMPGGGVSTLPAGAEASAAGGIVTSLSTGPGTSSSKGIASIIASSTFSHAFGGESGANSGMAVAGATQTTGSKSGSASSTTTSLSSPTPVSKSDGRQIGVGKEGLWIWTAFCVGVGLVLGI
jgi:hypothetical protein